jgi:hypothetical protein
MRHLSPRPSTRACQACLSDLRGMMPHRAPMPTSSQEFRLRLPDLLDYTRLDSTDSTTRRKRARYVSCALQCLGRTTFLRLPMCVYQARIGASGRSSARTSSVSARVTGLLKRSSSRLDVPHLTCSTGALKDGESSQGVVDDGWRGMGVERPDRSLTLRHTPHAVLPARDLRVVSSQASCCTYRASSSDRVPYSMLVAILARYAK